MRKLTHEEQVAAIAKVNPDVEVLGKLLITVQKYYVAAKFVTMNGRLHLAILNMDVVVRNALGI